MNEKIYPGEALSSSLLINLHGIKITNNAVLRNGYSGKKQAKYIAKLVSSKLGKELILKRIKLDLNTK